VIRLGDVTMGIHGEIMSRVNCLSIRKGVGGVLCGLLIDDRYIKRIGERRWSLQDKILSKVAVKVEVEPNTTRIHFQNLLEVTIDDSS
jgi:hypothetical protein